MNKSPIDTLGQAPFANGVRLEGLYPLYLDGTFKYLNRIKPHASAWWSGGAQSAQVIQRGKVDRVAMCNSRLQGVSDTTAPLKAIWNQRLYGIEDGAMSKNGPRVDPVPKVIAFGTDPECQAADTRVCHQLPLFKR